MPKNEVEKINGVCSKTYGFITKMFTNNNKFVLKNIIENGYSNLLISLLTIYSNEMDV